VVPVDSDLLRIVLLGVGGLMINIYYIIQGKMVKKMEMVKVIYIFFFCGFIGYIILFLANSIVMLAIGYWIANMGLAAFYMFINVMIGDVGDHALVETGKNRYSEFTANIAVFFALGPAITSFIITSVLQLTGYDGLNIAGQSDSAILGIRIIASIIPMIGLIACAILLKIYPLKGKYYQEMRQKYNKIKSDT
jgi:Na+/melibiose symporter-like transporter